MTRVLLVDDCEEFCQATAELLQDAGYEVTVSLEAEGILELCEEKNFELMICDLVLPLPGEAGNGPDGDSAVVGVDLLRSVKAHFPGLPIILVSGCLVGGPLHALRRFGADAVLSKPFGLRELMDCIRSVTQQSA